MVNYIYIHIYIHTETTEVSDYDQLEFLHTTPVSDFQVEHLNPVFLRVSVYLVANYPLSKWVITPVIDGRSMVNTLITGVISHCS
jgi:hypothetical protein